MIYSPHSKYIDPYIIYLQNKDSDFLNSHKIFLHNLGTDFNFAITVIVNALKNEDDDTRWAAAAALSDIGPTAKYAIPFLIEVLRHDACDDVRQAAILALFMIEPIAKDAIAAFVGALCDDDVEVCILATKALVNIGPSAVSTLIEALENEYWYLRRNAAFTLSLIEPAAKDAVPALINAMKAEDGSVAGFAQGQVRKAAVIALSKIGLVAVEALIESLFSNDLYIRKGAAEALGAIRPAGIDVIQALIAALLNTEGADAALVNIGPCAVPALIEALEDENWYHRSKVARVLGLIGPAAKDAVPVLIKLMVLKIKDDNNLDGQAAAEAIGLIGPECEDDTIIQMLFNGMKDVQEWNFGRILAVALARMGAVGIYYLIKALESDSISITQRAAYGLGKIGPAARDALPALISALSKQGIVLRDEDTDRNTVAQALEQIGETAVPSLIKIINQDRQHLGKTAALILMKIGPAAKDAVSVLTDVLCDRLAHNALRLAAAQALRAIGPDAKAAIPNLIKIKKSKDARLNAEIALAIADIGGVSALDEPEGIEVMGEEARAIKNALEIFRRIGEYCQSNNTDKFSFRYMTTIIDIEISDRTIGARIDEVSKFFGKYFNIYKNINLISDYDESQGPHHKLFDRGEKRKPTICPFGWQAWELTCRFLDRERERLAAKQ